MNNLHIEKGWIFNNFSKMYLIKNNDEALCEVSIEEWISILFYKSQSQDLYDELLKCGLEDNGEDAFLIRIKIVSKEKECENLVNLIKSMMEEYINE